MISKSDISHISIHFAEYDYPFSIALFSQKFVFGTYTTCIRDLLSCSSWTFDPWRWDR